MGTRVLFFCVCDVPRWINRRRLHHATLIHSNPPTPEPPNPRTPNNP
jgi:hypothetical protein